MKSRGSVLRSFDDPFQMDPVKLHLEPNRSRLASSQSEGPSRSAMESSGSLKVGFRGYICILILFVINLLNYMDRFTVAGVLTQIQTYFDINDAQGGLLQTIFIVFYMIFAPLCGFLGDRYNRKWIMTVGIAIWVLAVFASSFIPDNLFWVFLVLRGIVGVGEASYAIIAPTIIADLFTATVRSRVLMFFYFAIPLGSGLGYIVGSSMSSLMGTWKWGIRVTPILGVICLLLIITLITEPKRGEAEKVTGAKSATDHEVTSYWEDIKAICKIPTFVTATLGYTAVVFVTGTLSWWAPAEINHAFAMKEELNNTEDLSSDQKDNVSFIFGAVTVAGGVFGVFTGSAIAQMWAQGKWCFRIIKTPRANPLVCAIGSVIAVPFLFLGLHLIQPNMNAAWICIFITITGLCLNWATNVDMLLDVITPRRRSAASSWQTLISHLLGDASGPYIIGAVSDWIRGPDDTPRGHFNSLLNAFYIANVILIISAVLFCVAAVFFVRDRRIFQKQMGYISDGTKATYDGKEVVIKKEDGGFMNESYNCHL